MLASNDNQFFNEYKKSIGLVNNIRVGYWKDKKLSEEHKRKISLHNSYYWKNKKLPEETKRKMSESHKCHIPWNKGKTDVYTSETLERMSESKKGKPSLQKGKHLLEETKLKISLANKGRKRTDEMKLKMSLAHKGHKNYFSGKHLIGKLNAFYGKHHTDKSRKKMSLAKQGMYDKENNPMYGKINELCPAWLGGKSFEPYGLDFNKRFKEMIRIRDNYCCIICNRPQEELGYKLHIHHIDYDKKNSFPQNCVSLCRTHHIDTNFNRQQWKTFFQSLLKERYRYEYTEDQQIILNFIK